MKNLENDKFRMLVINYSGNVGKSTLSANLANLIKYKYNIEMPLKSFDGINSGVENLSLNVDKEELSGQDMYSMLDYIGIVEDRFIFDVGASKTTEDMLGYLSEKPDFIQEIDYFVVPVILEIKQVEDTIKTIKSLLELGVNKVFVVINKYDSLSTIQKEMIAKIKNTFSSFIDNNQIVFNEKFSITQNNILQNTAYQDTNLIEIKNYDVNSIIAEAKEATKNGLTKEEIMKITNKKTAKTFADNAYSEFELLLENIISN